MANSTARGEACCFTDESAPCCRCCCDGYVCDGKELERENSATMYNLREPMWSVRRGEVSSDPEKALKACTQQHAHALITTDFRIYSAQEANFSVTHTNLIARQGTGNQRHVEVIC